MRGTATYRLTENYLANRMQLSVPRHLFCRLLSFLCLVAFTEYIDTTHAFTLNMVEGHSVHRIASRFRTQLVGKKFAATSPNGRFIEGSQAINNRVLYRMEAVGKNLFAFFSPEDTIASTDDEVVVHVHFGMSGAWSVFDHMKEPEVKPTTRLRLEEIGGASKVVTHLSAMTVQHGDMALYSTKKAALGQDPLRPDADPDALWEKVKKSKKSIGQIIMDQSFFAGPGNIYRAEILFLAGIYPTTPGMVLDRASFDRIWDVSVSLLRRGYDTGSILTVDPTTDPDLAANGERRYIYNKSRCSRCLGPVRSWEMSGRTCYACEGTCQPKLSTTSMAASSPSTPKKAKANKAGAKKAAAKVTPEKDQHVPFISHCAPVNMQKRLEDNGPEGLTIKEIRAVLEQMVGAKALPPKSAKKAVHVEALSAALTNSEEKKEASLPPPMISAENAAREKAAAGEGRNVEHIAELSREQAIEAVASAVTPSPMASKDSKRGRKRSMPTSTKSPTIKHPTDDTRRRLDYD